MADAEDKILSELVPLAHEAIKTALKNNNADVALEIFKGVLPGFSKKATANVSVSSQNELEKYLDQLRGGEGLLDGQTIEGNALPALPAAAPEALEEGISVSIEGIPTGEPDAAK